MDSSHLAALLEASAHLHATFDREQLIALILQYTDELLGARTCSLFLGDKDCDELQCYSSLAAVPHQQPLRLPAGRGLVASVMKSGEAVCIADVQEDGRFDAQVDTAGPGMADENHPYVAHSFLAAPVCMQSFSLGRQRGVLTPYTLGVLAASDGRIEAFDAEDMNLLAALATQAATALHSARLYDEAQTVFEGIIAALATAIDAKEPYTEGHSERVSIIAAAIARQLGLNAEMVNHIRLGGLLHDIGKMGVPDQILKKPGHLTTAEMVEMQKHPYWGERILKHVPGLCLEQRAVAEHHERLDGTGYPNGLTWPEISLGGRILAVADVCDALSSERPYRAAMPFDEVLAFLRARVGMAFDANCVNALERAYAQGLIPNPTSGTHLPSQ